MFGLLVKLFVKDTDYNNPKTREKIGVLSGVVGVILNGLLFAFKMVVGLLSASISVMANAFDNLFDASSSVIGMVGFKLSSKPRDSEHPYGHGRMEYLAGLLISAIILIVGYELLSSSIKKIISPATMKVTLFVIVVMAVSILVKVWMFIYNSGMAKKINSATLRATSRDSISDVLSTFVVLVSLLINYFFDLNVDGYMGLIVSVFILIAGIRSIKDSADLLLGKAPDKEFVEKISKEVLSWENVVGVHDMIVHDYGANRCIVSLHAEVPDNINVNVLHECIDDLECHLEKTFNCLVVIHMDPITTNDERVTSLREKVGKVVGEIFEGMSIHDFRMVEGVKHTNLIFDVVLPFECKMKESEVITKINEEVKKIDEKFNLVLKIDRY